ncbi:SAM-dependent methyltransferase [Streptomyces sp. MAR4 CNY-716]
MTSETDISSEKVSEFYDQGTDVLVKMMGDNLHAGYWDEGDDSTTMEGAAERLTREMMRRLAPRAGQRILDVGCGVGGPALTLAAAEQVNIVGITISRYQVHLATERIAGAGLSDRVRFEEVDVMSLPYEDGAFDGAWFVESLLHVPDKVLALREVARVLHPGGRVVVGDGFRRETADVPHEWLLSIPTLEGYRDLVEEAGLVSLEVEDITAHTMMPPSVKKEMLARTLANREGMTAMLGGDDAVFEKEVERLENLTELPYVIVTARRD